MSVRVARSRVLVAEGHALAAVARVMQITRQALYRVPKPRTAPKRRPPANGSVDAVVVEVAKQNPSDGYRIVTAWVARKLGRAVNRKRVLRVMREQRLIQRRGREPKRRRPGFFKVERPGQLWHLDMTSVWVAEHGWVYLKSAAASANPRERGGSARRSLAAVAPRDAARAPERASRTRA